MIRQETLSVSILYAASVESEVSMELAFSNTQHSKENWQQLISDIKLTKPADRQPVCKEIAGKIFKALAERISK